MIILLYCAGDGIAHIVRERFTLKIKELNKDMNRNKLEKSIHEQIEGHVRLQYDNSYTEPSILQNLPVSSNDKSGAKNTLIKQFKSDNILHIRRQESELALKVNSATFHGDLRHLKRLINEGANLKKTDCDGHTPLTKVTKYSVGNARYSLSIHCARGIKEEREGIVMWIPQTMEELIKSAEQQLKCSGACILSEEGGKIFDVDLISDGQRLYMHADSELTNAN